MWIKLMPNDTTFFRSGRPFSLGDDTWAEGVFPPYPCTVYGAIRAFLIFERGDLKKFKEEGYADIGNAERKGSMTLIGPLLSETDTTAVYFPCPLDIVESKGKKRNKWWVLPAVEKPEFLFSSDMGEKILIFKGFDEVEHQGGWINDITLQKYLEGQNGEIICLKDEEFFLKEVKIGIARERGTLTSKESHIYRLPTVRLKWKYSLLVKINNINNFPETGTLQLGAEGKTVTFKVLENDPLERFKNLDFKLMQGIFKVYLVTPAIFDKGWIPGWIDETTLEGEKDGIKLKLLACAIGKSLRIGGWDMALNRPKPMYRAVPAGSVYWFKALNTDDAETINDIFHFKAISDKNPEEGFGLGLVGKGPEI